MRYIGCSNLSAKQITEASDIAQRHGLAPFITCQDEYSLLVRGIERENIPVMKSYGLGLLPYFPLASGLLTGKYRQGAPLPEGSRLAKNPRHAEEFVNERNMSRVTALDAFAKGRGHTLLELAMSWLAGNPMVSSVIAGASRPEQVEQNVAAIGWTLTADERAEVDSITA